MSIFSRSTELWPSRVAILGSDWKRASPVPSRPMHVASNVMRGCSGSLGSRSGGTKQSKLKTSHAVSATMAFSKLKSPREPRL
jgi:hypothetical protein